MPLYDYKIATNWNNAAGLTNFESISVSGGEDLHSVLARLASATYYLPQTQEPYNLPYELTAGGTYTQRGYAKAILLFPLMGVKSFDYLESTYGQGNTSYHGKVTVRLRSANFNSYANYNAIMSLANAPKPIYRMSAYFYQDIAVTFLLRGVAS